MAAAASSSHVNGAASSAAPGIPRPGRIPFAGNWRNISEETVKTLFVPTLEHELHNCRRKLRVLNAKLEEIQDELAPKRDRLDQLAQKVGQLAAALLGHQNQASQVQSERAQLSDAQNRTSTDPLYPSFIREKLLSALQGQLQEWKRKEETLAATIQAAQREIQKSKEEQDTLVSAIEGKQKGAAELARKIEERNAELARLSSDYRTLTGEEELPSSPGSCEDASGEWIESDEESEEGEIVSSSKRRRSNGAEAAAEPRHDLSLLTDIFPVGTRVYHQGRQGIIIEPYDPATKKMKVKIGNNTFSLGNTELVYVPEVGKTHLIRLSREADPERRYYWAKIVEVERSSTWASNSFRMKVEWEGYEYEAMRTVRNLDTILPISPDTAIAKQLRWQTVAHNDDRSKRGRGCYLQRA